MVEQRVVAIFILAALFWVLEPIPIWTTSVLVIVLMLWTGVLNWSDITSNKAAWNTFVWFATLVALADGLSSTGFIGWLGKEDRKSVV